jgi:hypothetical protein
MRRRDARICAGEPIPSNVVLVAAVGGSIGRFRQLCGRFWPVESSALSLAIATIPDRIAEESCGHLSITDARSGSISLFKRGSFRERCADAARSWGSRLNLFVFLCFRIFNNGLLISGL